jgi:hypothetical protein
MPAINKSFCAILDGGDKNYLLDSPDYGVYCVPSLFEEPGSGEDV